MIEGLNDLLESPIVLEYFFDLSGYPLGSNVLDVNVRIKLIDHTWIPDLNLFVENPAGQAVSFFTVSGCAGLNLNVDAWFDDEGAGTPGAGSTPVLRCSRRSYPALW